MALWHRLLERQLRKHVNRSNEWLLEMESFLAAVNEAYFQSDDDRALLERSLELSSQELMQANAELRAVFRAFPDMFYCWVSSTGKVLQHSEGTEKLFGDQDGHLLGGNFFDAFDGTLREDLKRLVEGVAQGGGMGSMDFFRDRGRERHFYELRAARVVREQIILMIRDMTERKQAEEALKEVLEGLERLVKKRTAELEASTAELKESEETFRKITAYAQDGIIMLDNEGRISFWNGAAEGIFGFTAAEVLGRELAMLIGRAEDMEVHQKGFAIFKGSGKGPAVGKTMEFKARKKDGSLFDIELSVSALRIKGMWHALGIVRDATQRNLAQDALRRAKEEAEAATRLKSEFLSMVSHELRTPLTSVLGYAKVIRKRLDETILPSLQVESARDQRHVQQVRGNIDIIVGEGERLTELINNVLDLARMEAGRFQWKMEDLDVEYLIDQSLAATAILFRDRGIQVSKEVAPSLPRVRGDGSRIIQVLINLLSNAAKFTMEGHVVCRAEFKASAVQVSVEDTGIGIDGKDMEGIFEKFSQAGDTLADKPRGTGLGLPISKEIVEHLGGRMWVESEPGKGTTFFFSLPVQ